MTTGPNVIQPLNFTLQFLILRLVVINKAENLLSLFSREIGNWARIDVAGVVASDCRCCRIGGATSPVPSPLEAASIAPPPASTPVASSPSSWVLD